jgi:ankyrin repeat protein
MDEIVLSRDQERFDKYLLEYKLEIDHRDERQSSILHYASRFGPSKYVASLLEHNADLNLANVVGDRPLHCAIQHNNYDIVKMVSNSSSRLI